MAGTLFCSNDGQLVEVPVEVGDAVKFGAPKVLLTKPEGADGDFVALKNGREFILQKAVRGPRRNRITCYWTGRRG